MHVYKILRSFFSGSKTVLVNTGASSEYSGLLKNAWEIRLELKVNFFP